MARSLLPEHSAEHLRHQHHQRECASVFTQLSVLCGTQRKGTQRTLPRACVFVCVPSTYPPVTSLSLLCLQVILTVVLFVYLMRDPQVEDDDLVTELAPLVAQDDDTPSERGGSGLSIISEEVQPLAPTYFRSASPGLREMRENRNTITRENDTHTHTHTHIYRARASHTVMRQYTGQARRVMTTLAHTHTRVQSPMQTVHFVVAPVLQGFLETRAHTHRHTQTHRHTDTQTHRHTDTQTHRHTDTQTQTQTHTYTHTHTHTHTHNFVKLGLLNDPVSYKLLPKNWKTRLFHASLNDTVLLALRRSGGGDRPNGGRATRPAGREGAAARLLL